jgi:hypothetical protein
MIKFREIRQSLISRRKRIFSKKLAFGQLLREAITLKGWAKAQPFRERLTFQEVRPKGLTSWNKNITPEGEGLKPFTFRKEIYFPRRRAKALLLGKDEYLTN